MLYISSQTTKLVCKDNIFCGGLKKHAFTQDKAPQTRRKHYLMQIWLNREFIKVTCRSKRGVSAAGTWVTGHQLHPDKVSSAWLKISCRQVHRRDSSASTIAFSFSKLWSGSYKSCNFQRFLILLSFMSFPELLRFVSWFLWVSSLLPAWNVWILRKPLHDTHDKILPLYVF